MPDESRRSGVQSVDRAFAALETLQESSTPLSVQEVARESGLDRTVAHRLLKTLKTHGMVLEERGAYRLGPQPVLMATRYTESLMVRRLALPYMVDLQTRYLAGSPFTVNLSIAVGEHSVVIERIWTPTTPLDLVLSSGDLFPVDVTATGRAILAYMDDTTVKELLGSERHDAIRSVLEGVRAHEGLASSEGEAVPGVNALAAVIRGKSGAPVAAIAVSCPDSTGQPGIDSPLAAHLQRAASAVGRTLP
jgi:DNA-binding IclR family transcriptional regulator